VLSDGSIDLDDPLASQISFFGFSIVVGILQAFFDSVASNANAAVGTPVVAFG